MMIPTGRGRATGTWVLFLPVLLLVSACNEPRPDSIEFPISGCWQNEDRSSFEVWAPGNDASLLGFGVSLNEGDIAGFEKLAIERQPDGRWIYVAEPDGQTLTRFKAVRLRPDRLVFANPGHDYPQLIEYELNENQLIARISLLNGTNGRTFAKIRCTSPPPPV